MRRVSASPLLFLPPFHRHARAACPRRSPSSRVCRHWSGMTSPTVKTIEPTSPVTVSSHAHRSSEWHTLRRDASWVSQALPFVYLSVYIHACRSCVSLLDDPCKNKSIYLFYFIVSNPWAGREAVPHLDLHHRIASRSSGLLLTWGLATAHDRWTQNCLCWRE